MATGDRIYLADKPTLDLVKQDTTDILGKLALNETVSASARSRIASQAISINTPILLHQITGEGFLTEALIYSNVAGVGYVRVTVDGTVICYSGMKLINSNYGIFYAPNMHGDTGPWYTGAKNTSAFRAYELQEYYGELAVDMNAKNILLQSPIYFKTGVKLELVGALSTTSVLEYVVSANVKVN